MTYRLPAPFLALIFIALLGGCHTAKNLLPTSFIPPNLRPPAEDNATVLKQAQKKTAGCRAMLQQLCGFFLSDHPAVAATEVCSG